MSSSSRDTISSCKTYFENRFDRLLDSDFNSDCVFIVGVQKSIIKGHKCLFSSASEKFKAMFEGDSEQDKPIILEGLKPETFISMKTFIYTGKLNLKSPVEALFTYYAAQDYLVYHLMNECSNYVKQYLNPSNVCEVYELWEYLGISELNEFCSKIILENTNEVIMSEDFVLGAATEVIDFILRAPSLNLKSEIELFEIFEKWALARAEVEEINYGKIASHFNHLKMNLRLLTISLDDFFSKVAGSLLFTPEEKIALVCNLKKFDSHPMPESLSIEQRHRNFTQSSIKQEKYLHKHNFIISIDNLPSSSVGYTLTNTNYPSFALKIAYTKIGKYICFQVEPQKNDSYNLVELMTLETKLEVFARKIDDNFILKNSSHVILDWNTKEQQKITFEKIPIGKLRNECFSVDSVDKRKVTVEFNVTFELGETLIVF